MVIVNFDVEECCKITSDKSANRINRRRGNGIQVSALDQALRNAPSAELDIADLPDLNYSHIYNRTKNFLVSSYERVKDFGKLLNGDQYCVQCREYRRLYSPIEKASCTIKNSQRFSDSFVEKVKSQHQREEMPCCAICNRPRPPVEYYCSCQEPPPRKVNVSCPYRRGSPRTYCKPKKKKQKKWWCCKKKKSENWEQLYCICDQQKMNRRGTIGPCMCKHSPSMLQKFRCYINGTNSNHRREDPDLYQDCCDEMPYFGGMPSQPPCGWCQKGCNIAMRQDVEDHPRRPRSERSSIEYVKMEITEDDYDDDTTESDDCCCCCPCRKNYNTSNIQTDSLNCNLLAPKTINTQTDPFGKRKRKCCKCCRNGCGICNEQPKGKVRRKMSPHRDNDRNRTCMHDESKNQCQYISQKSPRHEDTTNNNRKKTTILKSASVQHEPSETPIVSDNISGSSGRCPCHDMQNVMFSQVKTSPLFLDKMFTNPIHHARYNFTPKPIHTNQLHANTFLSSGGLSFNDETLSIPESTITSKTKKRFLNAVCDSILCDLTSRRRNSFSSLLKSPDSGYQDEPQAKRSLFSFKRHRHSNTSSKTNFNKLFANFGADSVDTMLKTLSYDQKEENNAMGEASKVVRGVLEEIAKNAETREDNNTNCETHELLKRESLRNILLSMASDSTSGDLDSIPGTSADNGGSCNDDSYMKLLKAMEAVRKKSKAKETKS